jgi:hypothetical protein
VSKGRRKRTWWTVPQVATWIRYRDAVRLVDVSEEEQPFERTTRDAILAALANGNLIAYADGKPIDGAFWGHGTVFLQRGYLAMAGLYRSSNDVVFDKQDIMGAWPRPADILTSESIPLRELLDQLGENRVKDAFAGPIAGWFLTLPGVLLTGLNPRGERIEIDTQALKDGSIGRHDGLIVGGHGRQWWTDVTVASLLRKGRKPTTRDSMVGYLRNHHPNGVPGDLKNAVLLDDMHKVGIRGGNKTLSPAISKAYGARPKTQ